LATTQRTDSEFKVWDCDDYLRRKFVPPKDRHRNLLGMAIRFQRLDAGFEHMDRVVYPNQGLSFVALRDIPVGHFRSGGGNKTRHAIWMTEAAAELRGGLPAIDFYKGGRSWDLSKMPVGAHDHLETKRRTSDADQDLLDPSADQNLFAIANRVNHQMTLAAFAGLHEGEPIRQSWFRRRPPGLDSRRIPRPDAWMPEPLVAFTPGAAEQLFSELTRPREEEVVECPCGAVFPIRDLRSSKFKTKVLSTDRLRAVCPCCRQRRTFHMEDATTSQPRRKYSSWFKEGFVDAVSNGMPLLAPGRLRYLGSLEAGSDVDHDPDFDLVQHVFEVAGGESMTVLLPRGCPVHARPGDAIEPGDLVARAMADKPPESWRSQTVKCRWATLASVCGGPKMVGHLQKLWFEFQGRRPAEAGGQVLYPARAVRRAADAVEPVELYWDMTNACREFLEDVLDAVILPPIVMSRWGQFRICVDGRVMLNIGISDPRFSIQRIGRGKDNV